MSFTIGSILSEKTFDTPFYSVDNPVEDMEISPGKEEAASNPPQETPALDLLSPDNVKTLQAIKLCSFKKILSGIDLPAWKSSTAELLQFDFKPAPIINNSDPSFAKIRTYLEKIQASIAGSLDMIKNNSNRKKHEFVAIAECPRTGIRIMPKQNNAPNLTFSFPLDLKDDESLKKISWHLKHVVIKTDGAAIEEQEYNIGDLGGRINMVWSIEGNSVRGTSSLPIRFLDYAFFKPSTIIPSRLVWEARYRESGELIGEFVSRQLVSFISKPSYTGIKPIPDRSIALEQNPTPPKKRKKNLVPEIPETLKNELANEIPTASGSAIQVQQKEKPKEVQRKEKPKEVQRKEKPKIISVDGVIKFLEHPNTTTEKLLEVLTQINERMAILLKPDVLPDVLPESQPMETESTELDS